MFEIRNNVIIIIKIIIIKELKIGVYVVLVLGKYFKIIWLLIVKLNIYLVIREK